MVLTAGDSSPLVTLFPRAFSGPSPLVSEVPKQPKVSNPPLEEDIADAPCGETHHQLVALSLIVVEYFLIVLDPDCLSNIVVVPDDYGLY
ncbi:hypothetical protein DSO57_1038191 [Entomophthora muscae]|uniref:Uncharacterized protein n=1 Tax=Entomophthora muscae TaxID=34485 RepID=A0ACC2RDG2_9FUNG|nr:hypothetical protein DSO57_1038191 [Entomophthora muscae]